MELISLLANYDVKLSKFGGNRKNRTIIRHIRFRYPICKAGKEREDFGGIPYKYFPKIQVHCKIVVKTIARSSENP